MGDPKSQNSAANGESQEEQYYEISTEELQAKMREHKKWLESGGKSGKKMYLENYVLTSTKAFMPDLRKVVLINCKIEGFKMTLVNFREADLSETSFKNSSLFRVNFQNAKLGFTNFSETQLENVDFRGANLYGANLQTTSGIETKLLAGCNLERTRPRVKWSEELRAVEETSKVTRRPFLSLVIASLYSIIMIATTTDEALLVTSTSSPLPIIGVSIPIVGFYYVVPVILFGLYMYFHFYLQRHWEKLGNLPAIFPDGSLLDEKTYPWLLNIVPRFYYTQLKGHHELIARVQHKIFSFLSWWLIPFMMVFLWIYYLPRHDPLGIGVILFFLWLSLVCALLLHRYAILTFRWSIKESFSWRRKIKNIRTSPNGRLFATGVIVPLMFITYTVGSFSHHAANLPFASADISDVDISIKPDNWTGDPNQISLVKGAKLRGIDFRYGKAVESFLVNADLFRAQLVGADFEGANLRNADLREANLENANLRRAYLNGAKLHDADLEGADFREADLENADFTNADIRSANFKYTHSLNPSDVKATRNRLLAFYDEEVIRQFGFKPDHNERVAKKDFSDYELKSNILGNVDLIDANFDNANLTHADFADADLEGVSFDGANVYRTDLRNTKNLNMINIKAARNWPHAFYDSTILEGLGFPLNHDENEAKGDLSGYNFANTDLSRMHFGSYNLSGANFGHAVLDSAIFYGANLTGVTGLTAAQLNSARIDSTTIPPDYLKDSVRVAP
jgi:uncharacterized protein YjbI with pentapeptide repeats